MLKKIGDDVVSFLIDEAELLIEQKAVEAESIGWLPLGDGAYLHRGAPDEDEPVIYVVGVPDAAMAALNVLLLV